MLIQTYVDVALVGPFENCAGLSKEQRSEQAEWLKTAADLGESLAMIEYSRDIADNDIAIDFLNRAWKTGDIEALPFLAKRYGQSYESGENPQNKVRAYSTFYAYNQLIRAGLEGHGDIASRWVKRNQIELDQLEKTLHQHEIEQGRELAEQLVQSNENCCIRM